MPEPGTRGRAARIGIARPAADQERIARNRDVVEDQPPRGGPAHAHGLEPRAALDALAVELDQPDADLDGIGPDDAGADEGVGQVRQPGGPGLLPGQPPRAVGGGLGGRPGHGSAGGRSAALLGGSVVDQRPVVDDRPEHPIAQARRDAGRIHQRADDVDLHREAERRRTVDGAERHQHLGRLRHPGTKPPGRFWHDQAMQPRFDDRLRRPRVELVAELEPAKPLEDVGHDRRDGPLRGRHGVFVVQALGPTSAPALDASMSASRRRSRVAACLALVTQCVIPLRYEGGRACQSAQAAASPLSRASSSSLKSSIARS